MIDNKTSQEVKSLFEAHKATLDTLKWKEEDLAEANQNLAEKQEELAETSQNLAEKQEELVEANDTITRLKKENQMLKEQLNAK